MSIESRLSGHWTDDELIQHLYGVGPSDGHVDGCRDCQARLSVAETQRRALEADLSASGHEGASYDFLMAQRRRIYAKLSQRVNRWSGISVGRLAPAAAEIVGLAEVGLAGCPAAGGLVGLPFERQLQSLQV